jgi:hypothetical protein
MKIPLTNYNIYLLNLKLKKKFKTKITLQIKLKKSIFDHCSILLYNQEQSIPHGQVCTDLGDSSGVPRSVPRKTPRTWTPNHRPSVFPLPHNGMDTALR